MKHIEHILWNEWFTSPFVSPVEDEIAGIINGLPFKKENGYYLFSSSRSFTVRRLILLLAETSYKENNIKTKEIQNKRKITFQINENVAEDILARVTSFGRRERNWNWIKGIWGSCGSLYLPRSGYYLVIRIPENSSSPERLQSVLKSAGFSLTVRKRIKTRELILRNQQHIVTFLSRLGLVRTTLALEETAIFRQMRNRANKLVNCDFANINKTLFVAQNQLKTIKKLRNLGILETLPEQLKELAYTREKNPSASLGELGQILSRPISKSTVKYRWRKIEESLKNYCD